MSYDIRSVFGAIMLFLSASTGFSAGNQTPLDVAIEIQTIYNQGDLLGLLDLYGDVDDSSRKSLNQALKEETVIVQRLLAQTAKASWVTKIVSEKPRIAIIYVQYIRSEELEDSEVFISKGSRYEIRKMNDMWYIWYNQYIDGDEDTSLFPQPKHVRPVRQAIPVIRITPEKATAESNDK